MREDQFGDREKPGIFGKDQAPHSRAAVPKCLSIDPDSKAGRNFLVLFGLTRFVLRRVGFRPTGIARLASIKMSPTSDRRS